jgi:hypothetical protein
VASIADGALSGTFVVRHRELFKQRFGEQTLRRALELLPAEVRDAFSTATAQSWVPVVHVQAVYDAMARVLGRDPVDLHFEIGRAASEQTVRALWRALLRISSDSVLVSQAPVFYPKAWNRGTLHVKLLEPGHAEARLDGWPDAPAFTIRGVRIALEVVLNLAGRKNIEVQMERTPVGAVFRARWGR